MVAMQSECCHSGSMPTLTIRNVPPELHDAIKQRARRNRRSVNQEVIAELSEAAGNPGGGLARERWEQANHLVDEMRSKMQGFPSEKELRAAMEEGRR
jgi:plasmid stability protein